MNSTSGGSLAERRELLCRQLQAQRQIIAHRLDSQTAERAGYPRSAAMRFLTRRPELVIRLLTGIVALLRSK